MLITDGADGRIYRFLKVMKTGDLFESGYMYRWREGQDICETIGYAGDSLPVALHKLSVTNGYIEQWGPCRIDDDCDVCKRRHVSALVLGRGMLCTGSFKKGDELIYTWKCKEC